MKSTYCLFFCCWNIICSTVYPKKYAHVFCFAVLCCGYTLTDFPISIRLTSLALWQSSDCPSASKATLMNMDKYFMWIRYKQLHNHNKAKHNKTVCIFLGIYRSSKWPIYPICGVTSLSLGYMLDLIWIAMHSGIEMYMKELFNDSVAFSVMTPLPHCKLW